MSFDDGAAFLELAKSLFKTDKNSSNIEAVYRTVISRAYFATFLCARAYLRRKNIQISSLGDAHEVVRTEMMIAGQEEISKSLNNLRKSRNKADYDANYSVLLNNVAFSTALAESVMTEINNLP
jgi:uncharacterized protein (UPF0332 family)